MIARNGSRTSESAPASASDKLWTPSFVIGALVNFLIMANYFMPMVAVTDYAMETFGASESVAGLAASIFIVGALVSRLASGSWSRTVGTWRLFVGGLVAEVVFSCLYFLNLGLYPLMALRFLHGFSYGFASTAVATIVTAMIPDAHKGEGVGYFMLSNTLGTAVGPFLGMALSSAFGIEGVFAACAVTAVASLAGVFGLKSGQTARKGGGSAPKEHGVRALIEPAALPIAAVACLVFFGYSSVLTFLTSFAAEAGLSAAASFFFVAYALTMFVSRLFTGKIFDRRGANVVMVPSFAAAAAGFALVGLAPNGAVLLLGAALLGFGIGTIQSCGLTIAVKRTAIGRLSFANSTYYALTDAGVGAGPLVLGALIPALGYRGLYLSMVAVVAVAFAWYLAQNRLGAKRGR